MTSKRFGWGCAKHDKFQTYRGWYVLFIALGEGPRVWLTVIASPQFQPQTSQNEVMGMGRVHWRDSRLECRQHPRSISRRGRALTGGLVVKKQRVP